MSSAECSAAWCEWSCSGASGRRRRPCSSACGSAWKAAFHNQVCDAMTADDQREVISFLSTPAAYGPATQTVERVDTHISVVFLAGNRAYKLKRAVRFDYVDFSTIDRRRVACEN